MGFVSFREGKQRRITKLKCEGKETNVAVPTFGTLDVYLYLPGCTPFSEARNFLVTDWRFFKKNDSCHIWFGHVHARDCSRLDMGMCK